jgi:hypothetical protein
MMVSFPGVMARWGGAGSFVGAVAGAVHGDLVAGVDEPAGQGFGDDGVGEQGVPVIRGTHMFFLVDLAFGLRLCGSGVSC